MRWKCARPRNLTKWMGWFFPAVNDAQVSGETGVIRGDKRFLLAPSGLWHLCRSDSAGAQGCESTAALAGAARCRSGAQRLWPSDRFFDHHRGDFPRRRPVGDGLHPCHGPAAAAPAAKGNRDRRSGRSGSQHRHPDAGRDRRSLRTGVSTGTLSRWSPCTGKQLRVGHLLLEAAPGAMSRFE